MAFDSAAWRVEFSPLVRRFAIAHHDNPGSSMIAQTFLEDKRLLWFVLCLTTILFAIGNVPWRLDDYDQAKQAFTSFEMVKEGHWLYQRTPNERVATKPPLVGWVSAVLFLGTRSWAMAWRLPSFFCALALLAFLYFAARNAYGKIAALLAASAFGLN